MAVTFTTSGYIEVYKDGVFVSRHRLIWEAVESVNNHGPGDYEIRQPVTKVKIDGEVPSGPPTVAELIVNGVVNGNA